MCMCLEHSLLLQAVLMWKVEAGEMALSSCCCSKTPTLGLYNEIIGMCKLVIEHGTHFKSQQDQMPCFLGKTHTKKGPGDQWGRLANWAPRYVVGSSISSAALVRPLLQLPHT
ncbi:hypothetical protein LI328DRAFT_72416 [Trichoderma asperelloides]|nr:hypothetical protein LI328DRAFT_72416 [Trichoderma asperelloides]